jgi:pyruvate-formate lyase-activating enzyme
VSHPPSLFPEAADADARPARVSWVSRPGAALGAPGRDGVPGLNVTRGCLLRCTFCPVRAAPDGRRRETVLYTDAAQRLAADLAAAPRLPRAVYVSPASDPFPPIDAVQRETARVVRALAAHGVEAWLMTRGVARAEALAALADCRERVKVTASLTTCDRALRRALEPWTAPPRLRLRQLVRLRRLGVPVQAALEPLIPGLTDTRDNLDEVLRSLAAAGVRHVTAGYLFLRGGFPGDLARALDPLGMTDAVREAFAGGPAEAVPGLGVARLLPRMRRQRGYATLMALAAAHGITVAVSRLSNPDFVVGPRPAPEPESRRRLLPLFLAAGKPEALA